MCNCDVDEEGAIQKKGRSAVEVNAAGMTLLSAGCLLTNRRAPMPQSPKPSLRSALWTQIRSRRTFNLPFTVERRERIFAHASSRALTKARTYVGKVNRHQHVHHAVTSLNHWSHLLSASQIVDTSDPTSSTKLHTSPRTGLRIQWPTFLGYFQSPTSHT